MHAKPCGDELISSEPQVLRSCQLYKLVMPEREVVVCSAVEGQQAQNSCPELLIFFLLASHGFFSTCVCTGRIWVLAGFIAAAQSTMPVF